MAEQGAAEIAVRRAVAAPRIVIDEITPAVDGGRFAAKADEATAVPVAATVFCDGHEALRVQVLWRRRGSRRWQAQPMAPCGNDRWQTMLAPLLLGDYELAIEAWISPFDNLLHRLQARFEAGFAVQQEWLDMERFLLALAGAGDEPPEATLTAKLDVLRQHQACGEVLLLLAQLHNAALREAVASLAPRTHSVRSNRLPLRVERLRARFASWYELFPRSQSGSPLRHGTLRDVIAQLPQVRAMGFDVLYLPPIHPIGQTHRKGRNNSLVAGPDDPGSPYAIGAEAGGHETLHPELGSLEDFSDLVAALHEQGMELALDFAVQCSPDHPWLREHPGWFDWRADGSLRHAENPPKRYEDIVVPDFYQADAVPALWLALREVVETWVRRGVMIFRVDNPHTKPLPFWEWLISDIRGRHPRVIFLSEAFTRPAMLHRLAKCGFSQSYSYFTWRNDKAALTEFFIELASNDTANYLRPHLFVNTPDINPYFLQHGGRAAFLIRAVLAATGGGLWGIYSGFEICEAAALPEREEYLDSEKYQLRPRDIFAPGHIRAEISLLNRLRAAHPALQTQRGFTAYQAWNEHIFYFGKHVAGTDEHILVAVCLEPFDVQEAAFEVPLWALGLPDDATVDVEDLCSGEHFHWHGKIQHMRIDPLQQPYRIWRLIAPPPTSAEGPSLLSAGIAGNGSVTHEGGRPDDY